MVACYTRNVKYVFSTVRIAEEQKKQIPCFARDDRAALVAVMATKARVCEAGPGARWRGNICRGRRATSPRRATLLLVRIRGRRGRCRSRGGGERGRWRRA